MNKKFLSVVLFGALMAGSSVTFTGCIDNDEPAGIENLRGAKAELLKAKAAVETAKVAYVNAQTAQANAEARRLEAVALQAELKAKEMELDNALTEAQNAEKIAAAEAKVAEIQAKLEQNKLNWEKEKLECETNLAYAQKAYEDAMKALELSKEFLSDQELAVLKTVQGKLTAAKDAIYGYDVVNGENTNHILGSKEQLDLAYERYEEAATNIDNYITKPSLEANLTNAQASLDFYKAELDLKLEALNTLKSGEAYQAWLKLKEEYTAKRDSLETEIAAKQSKANKIIAEQTPAIDALEDAIADAQAIEASVAAPKSDKDSTFAVSKAIVTDLDASDFGGFVTYDAGTVTAKFKTGAEVLAFVKEDVKELTNQKGAAAYATMLDDVFSFADGKDSEYKKAVDEIDAAVKAVNKKKAAIASLDTEKAEAVKVAAEKELKSAQEAQTKGVTAWTNSIAAWKKAEGYTTEEADKKAVEAAKKAYEDAIIAADKLGDDTEKAKAILKAQQTFADAIVKYYNAAAPLQLTVNKVTLKQSVTIGGETKESNVSKTVKEWLSDADNKDVYLAALIMYFGNDATKLWTVGKAEDKYDAVAGTGVKAEAGLATLKTKTEIKTAWATASINLFGKELGQNTYTGEGRETEPTETEIKAVWEKDNSAAGLYGAVMNAEVKLQTATENVEKAAQFDKVTAQLAAWKKSLANAKDAYIADNKEVLDAVVAAQKVVTENVATPITALGMDKDRALLGEINAVLEFSANDSDEALIIKHVNDLIETLQTEIGVKKGSFNEETGAYVETSTGLYLKIEKAESDVFEAQKMLDLYNSGDLTEQYVVDTAKAAYEAAKAQYEKDLETFNYWNAKLAELMETLYGTASAE
ncbi:hypothetical protein [Bacteroides sp.]|jgi:hypothetical protein|uniref:hypothetical protein n=2 Tax=Bacteroidaceae TaxID=815 RepID=UPI003A926260